MHYLSIDCAYKTFGWAYCKYEPAFELIDCGVDNVLGKRTVSSLDGVSRARLLKEYLNATFSKIRPDTVIVLESQFRKGSPSYVVQQQLIYHFCNHPVVVVKPTLKWNLRTGAYAAQAGPNYAPPRTKKRTVEDALGLPGVQATLKAHKIQPHKYEHVCDAIAQLHAYMLSLPAGHTV